MRLAWLSLAAAALSASLSASQPLFSARVDGVRVDVLVTDANRRVIRGLTAEDFVVRDNGVAQRVDLISFGQVPLNIGLAFDLSESVAGARLEQLRSASRALTAGLVPIDQSALVTFDFAVTLRCPFSTDRTCVDEALRDVAPDGETALVDGVFAAMMLGESDVGRSLLMVFSDGLDTASWMTPERVLDLGRRSDIVAYPIATRGARPTFLDALADVTGGRLHEVDRNQDLRDTFASILDEFRHRYLITYTPQGVAKGGWHSLDVRVRRPGARVRARPGYQG